MKRIFGVIITIFFVTALCSAMDKGAISVQDVGPYKYVAVEMTGNYDLHSEAFMTITEEIQKQGLEVDDVPFGIYYNNPMNTPEDQLKWDVGFAVSNVESVEKPLVIKDWQFTKLASFTYEGIFGNEEYNAALGGLWQWLGENGYQAAGPMMEKFLSMPEDTGNGMWKGKVEFYLPVVKM